MKNWNVFDWFIVFDIQIPEMPHMTDLLNTDIKLAAWELHLEFGRLLSHLFLWRPSFESTDLPDSTVILFH